MSVSEFYRARAPASRPYRRGRWELLPQRETACGTAESCLHRPRFLPRAISRGRVFGLAGPPYLVTTPRSLRPFMCRLLTKSAFGMRRKNRVYRPKPLPSTIAVEPATSSGFVWSKRRESCSHDSLAVLDCLALSDCSAIRRHAWAKGSHRQLSVSALCPSATPLLHFARSRRVLGLQRA